MDHRGWLRRSVCMAGLVAAGCAPPGSEDREIVTLTVIDAVQELFDGRSAATGFIVGKVPGAVLMGVAGGGPCRLTLDAGGGAPATVEAPPDTCSRLMPGDEVSVVRVTRRPVDALPAASGDVRYEWH
jgi:hypothetical protein